MLDSLAAIQKQIEEDEGKLAIAVQCCRDTLTSELSVQFDERMNRVFAEKDTLASAALAAAAIALENER